MRPHKAQEPWRKTLRAERRGIPGPRPTKTVQTTPSRKG